MDDRINELSEAYDEAQKTGRKYISQRWKYLRQETKDTFINSGLWDNYGNRIEEIELSSDSDINIDIEDVEYQLGILYQCASYSLPSLTNTDISIPSKVYSNEILQACDQILYQPQLHDPQFIRVALTAIRTHQMANLLFEIPTKKPANTKIQILKFLSIMTLGAFIFLVTILSPIILGYSLVSAFKQDVSSTVFGFYVLGFAVWSYFFAKNLAESEKKPKNINELSYNAWDRLGYATGSWLNTGAGARFYFEKMANEGINVPLIVFDLCALLEARVLKS